MAKGRRNGMIEDDTLKLLRECDAGVKMGIRSIEDVQEYVHAARLKKLLENSKDGHERLESEIESRLDMYHDEGKDPNLMARCMSWVKTNSQLAMETSDRTVANLMTDGCNMGVKSLNRYLNQYPAADAPSKALAGQLIQLEEEMAEDMRLYL